MEKNEINVYYKGVKQKIKYFGKFDESSIKSTIIQIFKIEKSLKQIYFYDENRDILCFNDQTPSGISIYIYLEPDSVPKNPSTALQVNQKDTKLIKFHWL